MTTSTFTGETGSTELERLARRHPSLVATARIGWVAKGIVYTLLGVLAVPIAVDGLRNGGASEGGDEASQTGAIAKLADNPFGTVALWAVAVGLALYVMWRLISILLPAENSAKTWATRAGYLVSAVVYTALALSALSFTQGGGTASGSKSEDARIERFTRDVMERAAGRWLVGLIGVAVIALGAYFVIRGLKASFRDELEPRGIGPISHEAIVDLGRVGWVGRGLVMGLVGWFLVNAARQFDPNEAKGIDGALRDASGSTLGTLLVGFVAVALIAYGVFCIVSAPRQRLTGAD